MRCLALLDISISAPPQSLRLESRNKECGLILQPGITAASDAFAPVAFARPLLMAPTPDGPMLHGLDRRRPLPDQVPEQPPHLRHGERQQPCGLPDGGFSPRWRAGAPR